MTMLAQGSSHKKGRPWWATVLLVVLAAIVLFVAGFGVAWVLRGGSSTPSGDGASPEPLPCTTVTVVPGNGLPKPGQVTTNVYNSTSRAGLAASTAADLKKRGFGIGKIDNDPLEKKVRKPAEIRYGPQGADAAQLMTFYIPGSRLAPDDRADATIDTVLGENFESLAPPAAVQKALVSPSPSPSGPGCPSQPAAPVATQPAASPAPSADAQPTDAATSAPAPTTS